VPERLVREPTYHSVARHTLASTLPAPPVRLHYAALDHRPFRLEALTDGAEAELVEAAERGQVRANEGSVEHVEVFQMDNVRTPILRETSTPTPPPAHSTDYTPLRGEPSNAWSSPCVPSRR
jgi:hypothetical protein